MPKYLSKSRFKLGIECPTKLYYSSNKNYLDNKLEDAFIEALAEGGFQVEQLAKLCHEGGIEIPLFDGNIEQQAKETALHLQKHEVILFEAAIIIDSYFVRIDILKKTGNKIDLIEVKAKSFDPENENEFTNKSRKIQSAWKPYLLDVAYQHFVLQKAYPNWSIMPYLMLADKSKKASVNGLNQLFQIRKNKLGRTEISRPEHLKKEDLGDEIISKVNVRDLVQRFLDGTEPAYNDLSFTEAVNYLLNLSGSQKPEYTTISKGKCKSCEYITEPDNQQALSGFHECWKHHLNWTHEDFLKPNVMEIWNFRKADKLINEGKIFLEDLTEDDHPVEVGENGFSTSERQWIQIRKAVNADKTPEFLKEEFESEKAGWQFPLHFIDFETSAVAIPFNAGRKPYEQIAFQFSHHIMYENGKIEHHSQFLNANPGEFPNFKFIRALKASLHNDKGSVFRYSTHENTILNAIYIQLKDSEEPDKAELMSFIKTITQSKKDSVETWEGERNMVDLCEVIKKYYYNPYTKGSNSIKYVLPAALNASAFLQEKYARPLKEIQVTSLNFGPDMIFVSKNGDEIENPYKKLPPLFEGIDEEELDKMISGIVEITNGGAALTAYSKLQFERITNTERDIISKGLLKYCELDTLAMVMIYEYLSDYDKPYK